MKRTLVCLAWFSVAGLSAMSGAFSIELGAASATGAPVTATAATKSWRTGTVVKIDGKSGELVLDGARRFTFPPGGGLLVRQADGKPTSLAAVKVGTRVKLSVFGSSGYASAPVSELWIVE